MKSNSLRTAASHFGGSLFHFVPQRFFTSLLLLGVLTFIAIFINDTFIRPFLGDVLVVIWLYYFMSSIVNISPKRLTFMVVSFAFLIEISQYFEVLTLLGLNSYTVLRIVLGATFDWMDLLAYALGGACCIALHKSVHTSC